MRAEKNFKKFFLSLGNFPRLLLLVTVAWLFVLISVSALLVSESLSGAFKTPVSAGGMLFFTAFFALLVLGLGVSLLFHARLFPAYARHIRRGGLGMLFLFFAADGLAVSSGAPLMTQVLFWTVWLAEFGFFLRLESLRKHRAPETPEPLPGSESASRSVSRSGSGFTPDSAPRRRSRKSAEYAPLDFVKLSERGYEDSFREEKPQKENYWSYDYTEEEEGEEKPQKENHWSYDYTEEEEGEELLPAGTSQQLRRYTAPDGTDVFSGLLRGTFAPNQRKITLFAAFCPPFSRIPAVECVSVEGEASVEISQLTPQGVRLSVKKSHAVPFEDSAVFQFTARDAD